MFKPQFRTKRNGVPILSDVGIDEDAEAFVRDFDPSLLTDPRPIDIEKFAEFYLGLTPEYNNLTNCGLILGRMVFNDTDKIPIYDVGKKRAEYISAKRGTLMIDNSLLEEQNEKIFRSTLGHECGHWVYHPGYFSVDPFQMSLFPVTDKTSTACRTADIECGGKKVLSSDHDWLEHHAKYFSAAVLMPKTAFLNVVTDSSLRKPVREFCDGLGEDECLALAVADTFNVSATSAKIRIRQLGASMDEERKRNQQQKTIFVDGEMQAIV